MRLMGCGWWERWGRGGQCWWGDGGIGGCGWDGGRGREVEVKEVGSVG